MGGMNHQHIDMVEYLIYIYISVCVVYHLYYKAVEYCFTDVIFVNLSVGPGGVDKSILSNLGVSTMASLREMEK